MGAQIISVVNQKGGTGKTTTTMNLGSAMAKLGKKILLIDLDPQANLTYSLGLSDPEYTISDVITGKKSLKSALVTTEKVDILAGSPEMSDIEISLVQHKKREHFLKDLLKEARNSYDYILIDSPPSLSLLTINSLTAATGVLIPMQLEVLTIQGLTQILSTVQKVKSTLNPDLIVKGIVLLMYDKRRKLTGELHSLLGENVTDHVYKTVIRLNVKIAEAPSFGQSVIKYDPGSHGALDYMSLAKEFIKKQKITAN
jgi:chromosome partitioning protein